MSFFPTWFDMRILFALMAMDVATTLYVLHRRIGREANSAQAWLMRVGGRGLGMLAPRVLLGAFVWRYSAQIAANTVGLSIFWLVSTLIAAVAIWNASVILRRR